MSYLLAIFVITLLFLYTGPLGPSGVTTILPPLEICFIISLTAAAEFLFVEPSIIRCPIIKTNLPIILPSECGLVKPKAFL